jgi:hypothetical protein
MEVIVHGTKGGYKSLKKTERAPSIASDIRNNAVINTILGNSFYAIAYTNNGFVFSKYKIVIDSLRNYATGFIAFSIILPQNKKLKGEDIKSMLDEMLNHYDTKYITNNKMNRGEISPIVDEDWTFLNEITNRFQELPQLLEFDLKPGEKEAAFILYEDMSDLVEFFSKPYQEEYTHHKQVFLIGKEQNQEDLLKFIKNSGIELKGIDLNNDYFILTNYEPHKNVIIKANGKQLSNQNNNIIRANDLLEIDFKINNFYKEIYSEGKLSDNSSDIFKYLEITANQIKLKYYAFVPDPVTKTLTIITKDSFGNKISDAVITCKNNFEPKKVDINKITFKGEDLGKNWTITAQKGYKKASKNLVPFERVNDELLLILVEEPKKVETPRFIVQAGEHGVILKNCYSEKIDGNDINIEDTIKPNKGWKFNYFKLEIKKIDDYDGRLIAQYKEKKIKHWVYAVSITLPLVIITSVFLFWPGTDDSNQAQSLKDEIEGYTHSIELNLEKLKDYESKWSNHSPQESKGALDIFRSQSNKISDSIWKSVDDNIKDAIEKRNLINSLSIDKLKKREFSPKQKKFEEVIKQVDIIERVLLIDCLDKDSIAKMNLDQIAIAIQNTLGLQSGISIDTPENINGSDRKDTVESSVSNNESSQPSQIKTETPAFERQPSANNNKSSNNEIIEKLKGGDISKLGLDDLKIGVTDSKLKNSIELYIKFWGMVTSTNHDDYKKILNIIKVDIYLKDSELKMFLVDLENQFESYKSIPGRNKPNLTINEFKKLMK